MTHIITLRGLTDDDTGITLDPFAIDQVDINEADIFLLREDVNAIEADTNTNTTNIATNTADIAALYITENVPELGGDFNAGMGVTCTKVGNMVTITGNSILTHSTLATPDSADGIIPAAYRPTNTQQGVFLVTEGGTNCIIQIWATGKLELRYYKDDGTFSTPNQSVQVPSITYVIT